MMSQTKSKFCLWCGNALTFTAIDNKTVPACSDHPKCGFVDWNNPSTCANVLLSLDGRVLLVKRAQIPKKGDWCLPGGFLDSFESPAEAATRELFEETGLESAIDKKNILSVMTEGQNDVQVFYWTRKITGGSLTLSHESLDLRFFEEHELPANIAFASHEKVIREWFAKNRRKPSNIVSLANQALVTSQELAYN
ncbi:MAG: NUDIX domain-containing protein [Candidatus Obscuribacterales bacterium]|nr:NUDIX domain-containing protein [Candidatus Obscuribacterales bacterium]